MTIIYWALNMLKAKYRQFTYVGAFISHKNANRWILFLSSVDGKEMRIEILSKANPLKSKINFDRFSK